MLISFKRSRFGRQIQRGFTLLELLAVVAIIVIVTAVILTRQSQFNSSTLLRSLAYSMALTIRQAQVYGTTVYGASGITSGECLSGTYKDGACFASGYGVYFTNGDTSRYILFGDYNGNGKYDSGPPNEAIKTFTLGSNFKIDRFCGGRNNGLTQDCSAFGSGSGNVPITTLSIIFKRPLPDACFSTDATIAGQNPTNACGTGTAVYASSSVRIIGPGTGSRTIGISATGQISVCAVDKIC